MSSTFEKLSSNRVKLSFVVPADKFEEGVRHVFRKMAPRFNIPGFRKGKAPLKVVEAHYGESIFYEDAIDDIFPDIYSEALSEHGIHAVGNPEELDVLQIGHGKDLEFTIEVSVRPDVTLGEYKNLGLVKTVDEVTDDDVMAEIERARDRASRYIEITDRPAKLDDQVNINYEGFIDDEPFSGGSADNHELVLGSGSLIPGFEDQLVGAEVGADVEVNVTFPEDYHAEDLKGKPAVFKVHVNGIREKETPALDDDFVKEVSEEADTVDEYKAEIRENLEKQADERAEQAFEQEVIEAVCANAEADIPEVMIDTEIDTLMRDFEMRLAYNGMRMEDFLRATNQTEAQMREMYHDQAKQRVMTQLVIDAIIKAENISADEAEVDAEIARYAEQNRKTPEEFKATLSDSDKAYFQELANVQKAVNFLKDNAT